MSMKMSSKTPLADNLSLADQARAIALEGLKYAKDPYDQARYEKLLEISSAEFSGAIELDCETLMEQFRRELGCVTPKLGTDAAVINDKGKILVLNRSDKTGWCLPCGWVDVGESPASAAVREVKEETGLDVEALGYISISTKGPGETQNIQHQVNTLVLFKSISASAEIRLSHEHTAYQWVDESRDDFQWHSGHDIQAQKIFCFIKGSGVLLPVE